MKKIAALAFLLCFSLYLSAQEFKVLEMVDVPDVPSNKVIVEQKTNILTQKPYYTASHMLNQRGISVDTYPSLCFELFMNTSFDVPKGCYAKLNIGGTEYMTIVFHVNKDAILSETQVYIDIAPEQIKYIATGGIQSIEYRNRVKAIYTEEFNMIEQELWRRTAYELMKKLADL
jgi:hypothetical protein